MGILEELNGALKAAQIALDAIGPRPAGNPDDIQACADLVRLQGEDTLVAAGTLRKVPAKSTLLGDPADKLRRHTDSTADEARSAGKELIDIADFLDREVKRVRQEIAQWELGRRKATNTINEITSAIGKVF